jgi:tetratricopeptide (TPR) repeat protein
VIFQIAKRDRILSRAESLLGPLLLWCALSMVLSHGAVAQSSPTGSLATYAHAIAQPNPIERTREMQHFLELSPSSSLRRDALEVLVWDGMQTRNIAATTTSAHELLQSDPESSLAKAAIADVQPAPAQASPRFVAELSASLNALQKLHQPEGMIPAEFALMKQKVYLALDGALGLAYLSQKEYADARNFLTPAVSMSPNDGRYVYGLALAMLNERKPETAKAYWYLARAVNLTTGSPQGQQISRFARDRYVAAGGSDAAWQQFLAAASFGTPGSPNSPAALAATSAESAGKTPTPSPAETGGPPELAKNAPPVPPDIRRHRKLAKPTAPVSLGILIQTRLLKGQNRRTLIFAISDLVKHLRENDEAFLMAFSDQLDFEQDLTAQDKLLEDALDQIQPHPGAALFESIAFAVGHLDRVGKNKNRVLLVISDGRNSTKETSGSAPLSSRIGDVRIDCIGLDASGRSEKELLQRLAQYSGGEVSFASTPQQLRAATSEMAESMGIEFPE